MTVTTDVPDVASVVRVLSDANVQFVVVGEAVAGEPLRVVVSRHPTSLDALGRALDRLDATVRGSMYGDAEDFGGAGEAGAGVRHVGDPLGTIPITTSAGDVDVLLGGPRRSLYAEVAAGAEEREVAGRRVQWTAEVAGLEPPARVTSRMLGRRLLSLAEGLAHLIDRQEEPADGEATEGPDRKA